MTVLLVNAAHIKAVPGRKTDIKDAEWIADLLQHGLLHPSFIPPAPQRELRELTRYRSSLVADCARIINRFQKVLEDTNLKLASVVTDVTGVSARAILRAYLSGEETDPWKLANLARGSLRGKQVQLAQAMVGEVKEHHRFLLLQQMALIEILERQIAEFDQKIAERIEQDAEEQATTQPPSSQGQSETASEASSPPLVRQGLEGYAKALARLDGIPGINRRVAEIVLAEIGINMEQFPSDGHLASWAGCAPAAKSVQANA